jgi:steroid delta-isomerase-like uncharacterized protein
MSIEESKILATRFYEEILNGRKMDIADEILSEGYIDHSASAPGLENFKTYLGMITTVFPDINVKVEDMVITDDKVAVRLAIRGTQQASFRGFPATGKEAAWSGMDIIHISNGMIVERWSERDFLDMLRQLDYIHYPH